MVLSILSYGTIEDIQNTRIWQTEKVKECTTTRSKLEAAKNDNLDTMKWIQEYIGDIEFKINSEYEEDGKRLPSSCAGN